MSEDLVALFIDDEFEDPYYTSQTVKLLPKSEFEKMCITKVEKTETSLKILVGSVIPIPQGLWYDESYTPYPVYYLHYVEQDYEQSFEEIERKEQKLKEEKEQLDK